MTKDSGHIFLHWCQDKTILTCRVDLSAEKIVETPVKYDLLSDSARVEYHRWINEVISAVILPMANPDQLKRLASVKF